MRLILKICFGLMLVHGLAPLPLKAQSLPGYPSYSAGSIANSAANIAGFYAPNVFISIYGQNLADNTLSISPKDIHGSLLPDTLPNSLVRVLINHQLGTIFFTSAGQVNVLIPPIMVAGPALVQLVNGGKAGPEVKIQLTASAPALFAMLDGLAIATHADGALITREQPAARGEVVVLWAGGLGPTNPALEVHEIPQFALRLVRSADFQVWLNGTPVEASRIQYAGVSPQSAGLFQINVKLPDDAPNDPDVRVGVPEQMSPPGRMLPLR